MSKKLLPCPLCGLSLPVHTATHAEVEADLESDSTNVTVICDRRDGGCGTTGGYRDTKKEARKLWNTRHYAAFGTAAKPCDKAAAS